VGVSRQGWLVARWLWVMGRRAGLAQWGTSGEW
jgi:hypothetical protein